MAHVSVLIVGCGLLGQELCKNILLGGIRHVGLMGDEKYKNKNIELLMNEENIGEKVKIFNKIVNRDQKH